MPDGQGYQVAPDELTAHASSLDQIGRTLGQAVSAAQQVTMGTQAYGMIAGPLFVPIVTAISSAGIDALSAAQTGVANLVRGINDTAASYHELDQDNATRLTAIHTPGDNS